MNVATKISSRKPAFLDGKDKELLINGKWRPARSGKLLESVNPSDGQVIGRFADAGEDDVNEAVAAARAAFEGPWRKFTPMARQDVLLKFADIVERNYDELLLMDAYDMGSPIGIPRPGVKPSDQIRYFAGWTTKIHGETLSNSAPGSSFAYTLREPIGVVGSITAWNNPTSATIQKLLPALTTGCTIVLKPSEQASLTALFLGKLMDELDLPPGVLNIVTGGGAVGAAVVNHRDVDKIAFTGSSPTGQSILRASAGNLKRVTLELGGKSPDIIFADADLDKAAPAAAMGVFGNTGQMCIAGTRVYVQRPIYDEFIERMTKVANGLRVGHSLDPQTQLGPLASSSHLARVEKFMKLGKDSNIRLAAGGSRITDGALADGYFVQPTIFADTHDNMEIVREEIFGPVATVMPFDDFDEVIRRANDTPFGLACGVWTSNIARAHNAAAALRAGICWVNTFLKMDPNVPFGGYKMSGIGKELGAAGLDDYLIGKSVWIDTN